MAFLGQEEQIREFQDRFRYLYVIVFLGLGLLLSRMVYLQVLMGDKMRDFSEKNRIRRVKIAAPRGMIFDRNRKLLVDNRPAFDLEVIPQYLRESKQGPAVLKLLARLIKMKEEEIADELEKASGQPSFMPVKVKSDLTREEVALIESWKISMPGVEIREEIRRTNVYGEIASHMLGYIGEVNTTELPIINKDGTKYSLGDNIGKFGLEQKMEPVLRGIDGEEIKEVDALGRSRLDKNKGRVLADDPNKAAIPGRNLVLTIDQDLQLAANEAFGDKIGSVVAIDPNSGQILAMLSRPSFDPTQFSRGIPTALWNKLLNNENHPLRDKTIQDHYPPGSTFKLLTAIAGLEEGVIDVNTRFSCTGSIKVGNRPAHCWKKGGHGSLNVVQAIQHSCDVFFYRVAQKLKSVDDLAKWAHHMGMGKKTGITLPRETSGLIPTEAWKEKVFHQPWNPGETVYAAIGQGYVLTTAIQLANFYAAMSNGGTLYRPYLVKQVETVDGEKLQEFQPEAMDNTRLNPKTIEAVKQGMWNVVNVQGGTAYAYRLPGMDFAGKTGTAQVIRISSEKIYSHCENMRFRDRHHGLFVGFAPLNDPKIAVAVVAEHACHGTNAAPVARAIIKRYLEKIDPAKYGEAAVAERLKSQGKNPLVPMPAPAPPSAADDEDQASDDDSGTLPEETAPPPPAPPLSDLDKPPIPGGTR